MNNLAFNDNAKLFYPTILTQFNITWANVTYAHLDIPVYSALATRLVLAGHEISSGLPIPSTDVEQVGNSFF